METKIKVAFDLDGVIIDKPPLIPKGWLEWLFRGGKKNGLHYRFPKFKIEQAIRKLSHFYLLRPPIKQNLEFIKELAEDKKYELYIISGRYSFLEKETEVWLEKRKIKDLFKGVFLNLKDEQPHLFKEEVLKQVKPEVFVDDDGLLADYLTKIGLLCKIHCLSPKSTCKQAVTIADLSQIKELF